MRKATNKKISADFLKKRYDFSVRNGFPNKQKWIIFCETLLADGFTMRLYEARKSVSKYITVTRKGSHKTFRVRFSNHRPIPAKEANKDCDFFVGVSNTKTTNTIQAIDAVKEFFK